MKRRARETSSLELLLDTVTNAFGGVFFVAVLVTMLLRATQSASHVDSTAVHEQNESDKAVLAEGKAELQRLEFSLSQHESTLDGLTSTEEKQAYRRLMELRAQFEALAKQRIEVESRVTAMKSVMDSSGTERDAIKNSLEEERSRNGELERLIEQEKASRTRKVELPSLRETQKLEFPILVRYGRLYSAYISDPVLLKRKRLDEFVILAGDTDKVRVTPKPYRGIPLDASIRCAEAVRQRLDGIDKETCYVAVAVWDDSFEEFAHLRRILVDAGFDYRLLPIPDGEMIWEGGSGQAYVQ